jgi:hypothetical protein
MISKSYCRNMSSPGFRGDCVEQVSYVVYRMGRGISFSGAYASTAISSKHTTQELTARTLHTFLFSLDLSCVELSALLMAQAEGEPLDGGRWGERSEAGTGVGKQKREPG